MRSIGIIGQGFYVPERIATNADIISANSLTLTSEWARDKAGIEERRVASGDENTSDLAVRSANSALRSAYVAPEEIDLIIVATTTAEMVQPSAACLVMRKLGIEKAVCFDIVAECSGFLYALNIARDMLVANLQYRFALVIGAETYSRILDYTDRSSCMLFGDGAGAMVLGAVPPSRGIMASYIGADASGSDVIQMRNSSASIPVKREAMAHRKYFRLDGERFWHMVEIKFPEVLQYLCCQAGLELQDIDMIIASQANKALIELGMTSIGLPMDRTFVNIEKYANTSAASVPIAFAEAVRLGRIRRNSTVALVAFGGGATWGGALVRMGDPGLSG